MRFFNSGRDRKSFILITAYTNIFLSSLLWTTTAPRINTVNGFVSGCSDRTLDGVLVLGATFKDPDEYTLSVA